MRILGDFANSQIVVNDFVPNEERTEPSFALRFSVYTLTLKPEGGCWTLGQYSDWLKTAGSVQPRLMVKFRRHCREQGLLERAKSKLKKFHHEDAKNTMGMNPSVSNFAVSVPSVPGFD